MFRMCYALRGIGTVYGFCVWVAGFHGDRRCALGVGPLLGWWSWAGGGYWGRFCAWRSGGYKGRGAFATDNEAFLGEILVDYDGKDH